MKKFYFTGSFLLVLFFTSCKKNEALTAIFNVSSPEVFEGYSLDFSDVSYGAPTAWEWSFQGGNPSVSNVKNPTNIQYDTPGTYSVSLTVSNAEGTHSRTIQHYISVIGTGSTQVLLDNGHSISSILTVKPLDSLYGKKHEGGLIFYISQDLNDNTLLISAENDLLSSQNQDPEWGCKGTNLPGGDAYSAGGGYYNTEAIIAGCPETDIAARLCSDAVLEGYNDWVMPSSGELVEMNRNLHLKFMGNFGTYYYWSSKEYNADKADAMIFGVNYTFTPIEKDSRLNLRPIRILDYN